MAKQSNTHKRLRKARHLANTDRLAEARELYLNICRKHPRDIDAWLDLAVLNRRMGALHEAEHVSREVLLRYPDNPNALHVLGSALHRQGRLDEAIGYYRQALLTNPDHIEAHYFLANVLREKGITDEAVSEYQKTITLDPEHVEALNNLAALLTNQGKIQQSAVLLQQALQVQPNSHQMLINLGRAYIHAGNAEKAETVFRRVIELQPGLADAHSNLLTCLNYLPEHDPCTVFKEHRHWNEVHTASIQPFTSWLNEPDPERILHVGYVSPDLHEHSVVRFLEPVLTRHDSKRFKITCYSDTAYPDSISKRLQKLCDHWHETSTLPHESLAKRIKNDRIDILVDLAGHTAYNRMLVFARKPAPLQVTWLGYPNTTGLQTIDYRLTDINADPPGETESLYTEKLIRLPHSFLCYNTSQDTPDPVIPPSESAGYITFGSFNNLAKTTPEVLQTWSRILAAVPDARLLLKSKATDDTKTQQQLLARFAELNITSERIGFMPPLPSQYEHLAAYGKIDIALDTFPYNGTTTTCEALWMGVPVIALAGRVHAARVGVSLLTQVGLKSLVTENEKNYVNTAIKLATDREKLAVMRHELRKNMQLSTLCDGSRFTKNLEQVYRRIWVDWCQSLDTVNANTNG